MNSKDIFFNLFIKRVPKLPDSMMTEQKCLYNIQIKTTDNYKLRFLC